MKGKRKINWFRILLAGLFVYFSYVGIQQQLRINDIDAEMEAADLLRAKAERTHKELAAEYDRLHQSAYIEKIAREELGLVKPGEMPYISAGET